MSQVDPSPQRADTAAQARDHTQRVTFTHMIGVYLAVNAVRDLYLLVEGPDCAYMKTQYIQGNHDWLSTLTNVSGLHRVANTALHPDKMTGSREEILQATLLRIVSEPSVPALALTSMPMALVTGADYGRLTREASRLAGKPIIHVPGKSLSGDWLDGYAEVLAALAAQLELGDTTPSPDRVALVGYLFDRNEQDHAANLGQLRDMFGAVGLELVSVWLAGQSFDELLRAREAGTIVSLPYGRKAAHKLARRTGARVLDMELPFGFDACERWMTDLGRLSGQPRRASEYVESRLAALIPRLEWVVPFVFQNRSFAFVGDPHLLPGFAKLTALVGARLQYAVITNRPHHADGLQDRVPGVRLIIYPKMKELMRFLSDCMRAAPVHLTVTNNAGILGNEGAMLEFGFPSYFRHALYDRPFLGFDGAVCLLDSMANTLRWHEVEVTRRRMGR